MSWKDLDIKQKAELIKLGVQSGIRDIKQIRQLYDDNNIPTQVLDQSYNETNVKPLQGIERIKQEYGIPEEEINKANDIIQQIEKEISLEEINNQQPIQFRQFSKEGLISNNPTQSYSGGGPIKRKRENSLDWRMAVYNAVDPRTTVKNIDDAFRLYNAAVAKEKRGEDFKDYTLNNNIGDLTSDAAWRKRLELPYDETLLPVWNGDTVSLSRPLELEIPVDTNLVKNRIDYAKDEFWNDVKSLNLRQLKEDLSYKKSQEELLDALRYTYKTGKPIGVSEYHANSIDPEKVLKDFKYGISPLNVLGRYNIRYDKDENKMYYSDEWDFNQYEWAVPGTTFRIRGAIPLDKKKNGGFIFPTKTQTNKVNKFREGGHEDGDENTIYTAGYSEPITVTAKKEISKKQQMEADEEWREYLKQHPIQIGSDEYNRLPEKAKAQVYKNSVTNAIDKAALPTAAAIIAPTLLTSVGTSALPAVGKALANPIVDAALTVHGAVAAPENVKQGIQQIKNGEYWKGAFNLGLTGLDVLGAGSLIGRTGRMLNPNYRRLHAYNSITPTGYGQPYERFKQYISDMWNDVDVDIKNPKWLQDLKKEYGKRPQYGGYTKVGNVLSMENAGKIADEARQDAWALYNKLPQQHGTYIKNSDGTYSYNMEKILNDSYDSFDIPYEDLKRQIQEGLAPIDFVTGAGGRVRFDSAGRFTEEGDLVGNIFLEDVWDLHPFSRRGNKVLSNQINKYLKDAIGTKKMREGVQNFREWMFNKGHWSIFNPEDRTLFGKLLWPLDKHLNSYRIGAKVKKSKTPGQKDKIVEYTPIMDNIIDFITTNKLAKKIDDKLSLFEVGSITGGKPFTMKTTIPFIRRKYDKSSNILGLSDAYYPYFNDINIDLPQNLWEMKGYNDLYDIFGNAIK